MHNSTEIPVTMCLHQLIEDQAKRTPNSIAAIHKETRLTYGELNHNANQMACHLRKLGVGPEVPVGICMERSPELMIGLLGILKAGGAYVPLDPALPPKRLHFMIEDAQLQFILTTRTFNHLIPKSGIRTIFVNPEEKGFETESEDNLPNLAGPENLAYIIYTSGSTGEPKGVLITHRSVVNHCTAMIREFELQPNDRVLQFSTINFDLSVEEIFPTWICGATLVLRGDSVIYSTPDFMKMLEQERITVLDIPTAFWHEWIRSLSRNRIPIPPFLRLVVVGGETASFDIYKTWKEITQGTIRWINTYGPTETTVTATLYDPDRDPPLHPHIYLSLGRPIANTQIHILDSDLHPVPWGTPGELHIGGVGVARGYLKRPELTREKFIPNPFSEDPTAMLYKTGDRAAYQGDGGLKFLGRMDYQVKIRGFRVELGEIEAALSQYPFISEAVVLAKEDEGEMKKLIAYIIPQKIPTIETKQVRSFLKTYLPDYMIPVEFLVCNEFPKTLSGKVDREALKILRRKT